MTRHHPTEPLTVVGAGGLSGSAAHPVNVRRRHRPTETPSLPHPAQTRVLMKGNEAMAEAAIQAGCDAYFGYPITPQAFRMPPRLAWDWNVTGADGRPPRVVKSLHLHADDLEKHNHHLAAKYREMAAREVRWAGTNLEDAELVVVAYGTAARIASTAVDRARAAGLKVGLFRPITLFPFPTRELRALATRAKGFLVVELSMGQMVEDVQLAVLGAAPVAFYGRTGGSVPVPSEIVSAIERLARAVSVTDDLDWGPDPTSLIERPGEAAIAVDESDADPDPLSLIDEGAWWAREHEVVTR